MRTRWFLQALLLLLLIAPVLAEPASVPGEPFPEPSVRSPSDYWFGLNALSFYHEQTEDDHRLYFWAFPSALETDLKIRAPRLAYQWRDRFWLDTGTLKNDTGPFISPLTFRGVRGDINLDNYRLSAGFGETSQDFTPRVLAGQPEFSADHLSLTRRLGDYGYARLSTSGWRPNNSTPLLSSFRPPESSRVVSLDVDPDFTYLTDDLQVSGGYGLELTEPTGSLPGDRRAYGWDLTWRKPNFRLDARQHSQGRAYGPGHFENFRRGQSNLNISGTVDILPNLQWRESYDRFVFAFPIESGRRRGSENDTLSHELHYQPTPDLSATALLSHSHNKIQPGDTSFDTKRIQFRTHWRASDKLSLDLSHFDITTNSQVGETQSRRTDLRADYWLDERNRLTALVGRSRVSGLNTLNQGLDLGFGYEHLLADDIGRFRLDYRRSRFGFSNKALQSYQANLSLNPDPRWRIRGSYAVFDTGFETQTSASLDMNYLLNEHQEIGFTYNQRPFLLFPDQSSLNLGMTTYGIQLRQSFGGTLNDSFARRLKPKLKVVLIAEHPERPEATVPIKGAGVRVDGELLAKTNEDGTVEQKVSQGDHRITLDLSEIGRQFVLSEDSSGSYHFGEGDRRTLRFKAVGYSGLRIITWNDFFGEEELPIGYVPVTSVPLLVDGETVRTDEQGEALLERLSPGEHEIRIPPGELPSGLEVLGPKRIPATVEPGQEALISIPLRGFAQVNGSVNLVGGLKIPSVGLGIQANGREVGRTDEQGRFSLKVPAGNVVLQADANELGSRAFVPGEPVTLELKPGDSIRQDLTVSRTAELVVQLTRQGNPVPSQGVPFTLEGEGFRYTDSEGRARFPKLSPGRYTLTWQEGERELALDLQPGEDRTVSIDIGENR